MRRGTLIYRGHRQLTLARSILARQPLLARLTRHQQLPQALGLPAQPVSQPMTVLSASPDSLPTLPVIGRNFHPAIPPMEADAGDNEHLPKQSITDRENAQFIERTTDDESSPEQAITNPVGADFIVRTADLSAPVAQVVDEADKSTVRTINGRLRDDMRGDLPATETQEEVQPPASMEATEQIAPLPEVLANADEATEPPRQPVEAKQQVEGGTAEEIALPGAKPPIETVRPRRPRRSIDELMAQAGPRPSSSPPAATKETPGPQRNAQVQRPEMKTQTASEGEIRADDLFLPTNTDRSPQAWLARLMGKSLPAQENTAAAHIDSVLLAEASGARAEASSAPTNHERRIATMPRRLVGAELASALAPLASALAPLPDIQGSETPVDKEVTIAPQRGGDQDKELSQTKAGSENGLPFNEQAQSQSPVVGQPTRRRQEETRQRGGQSQPQAAQAPNLRTIAAMPGTPGALGMEETARIPAIPETSEAARTVQARQAEPLSARARRFLRPLVGIDPASMRVHRDAQASRLADAYHADAVTRGNDVELAAEFAGAMETPETLGLLAHELTHVARQREPGFVPPIVQTQTASAPRRRPTSAPPITTDEETLALHVERQVRQTAEMDATYIVGPPSRGGLGSAGGTTNLVPTGGYEGVPLEAPSSLPSTPFASPQPVASPRQEHDRWGGLPAPWEPLPGWLAAPQAATATEPGALPTPVSAPAPAPVAPVVQGMASSNGSHHQANGHDGAEVQRAGKERAVGQNSVLATSALPAQEMRAPEPDLDELARQVYSILRNRLEVERRRHR